MLDRKPGESPVLPLKCQAFTIDPIARHANKPPTISERVRIWLMQDSAEFEIETQRASYTGYHRAHGPAVILVPAGMPHAMRTDHPSLGVVIALESIFLDALPERDAINFAVFTLPELICREPLIAGLNEEIRQFESKAVYRDPRCAEGAGITFCHLVVSAAFGSPLPTQPADRFPPDVVNRIVAHITESLDEGYNEKTFHTYFGYGKTRFVRLFKNTFGCTPGQFWLECQFRHAKKLLRETSDKVIDVAAACGLTARRQERMFKKILNVTPTEYRENPHL